MYQRFLNHTKTDAERNALIDGFRIAMAVYDHGYPLEYSNGKDHLIGSWVINTCHEFFHKHQEEHAGRRNPFFAAYQSMDRTDFYHMLFHKLQMTENGFFLYENGNPKIDESANNWEKYVAVDWNGHMYEKADYEAMIANGEDPSGFTLVRFIEAEGVADGTTVRLYADDVDAMQTTIKVDIMSLIQQAEADEPIAESIYQYMIDHCTKEDPIFDYREFIQRELKTLAYAKDKAKKDAAELTQFLEDLFSSLADDEPEAAPEEDEAAH